MEFYENEELIEALEREFTVITTSNSGQQTQQIIKPSSCFNALCFSLFNSMAEKLKFIYDENIFWEELNDPIANQNIKVYINRIINIFNAIIDDNKYLETKNQDNASYNYNTLQSSLNTIFNDDYNTTKLKYINLQYITNKQLQTNLTNYENKLRRLSNLTKLYESKLKLSEPAKYFKKKAAEYSQKAEANMDWFICLMKITALIPIVTIILMIWLKIDISAKMFFIPIASLTAISFFTALTFRFLSLEDTFLANEMDQKHVLIYTYLATSKATTTSKESLDNLLAKIFSIAKPRQKSVLPQEVLDVLSTFKK